MLQEVHFKITYTADLVAQNTAIALQYKLNQSCESDCTKIEVVTINGREATLLIETSIRATWTLKKNYRTKLAICNYPLKGTGIQVHEIKIVSIMEEAAIYGNDDKSSSSELTSEINFVWRVHTPKLLKEIMKNPTLWALSGPVSVFSQILGELTAYAQKINDPELNALMCRLTLYDEADPTSKHYKPEVVEKLIAISRK